MLVAVSLLSSLGSRGAGREKEGRREDICSLGKWAKALLRSRLHFL
jgi:hypothetical protein